MFRSQFIIWPNQNCLRVMPLLYLWLTQKNNRYFLTRLALWRVGILTFKQTNHLEIIINFTLLVIALNFGPEIFTGITNASFKC